MSRVSVLDEAALDQVSTARFQNATPYPWINPAQLIHAQSYAALVKESPALNLFHPVYGKKRAHGQTPHDRMVLEYDESLAVSDVWHQFVAELKGPVYRAFLSRLLGKRQFELSFHWHYTATGCSVSPHCDALYKLGSHIFYLNTQQDWEASWGGETLILDDGHRFSPRSAPKFADFEHIYSGIALDNYSLLFARQSHSWHGVKPLQSPEGVYRKVFIVVINDVLLMNYPRHIKPWLQKFASLFKPCKR